jgi:hypothetical protein
LAPFIESSEPCIELPGLPAGPVIAFVVHVRIRP